MISPFSIDFVGIGAAKSGTTWLGHMLEEHPELCMSVPKEIHFFNDRLGYRNTIHTQNFARGLHWYRKHFNHCGRDTLIGEIAPRYSIDAMAPQRLFDCNPNVKLLYCLRHPIDRIESDYNFARYFLGKEDRPMEKAIQEEPEFIDMTMYFKNLSGFLQHFPKEQIMLVWFDDIKHRPEALVADVFRFLGVDPGFTPSRLHKKSNPARESKSPWLEKYIWKINETIIQMGFSGVVKRLKKLGLGAWLTSLNSKPLQKDRITPELKQWILEKLEEDIGQLELWSGRDVSHWRK